MQQARSPYLQRRSGETGDLNGQLGGIREIQVFTQEEREKRRVTEKVYAHAWAIARAVSLSAAFHGGVDFFAGLGTVFVVFFGGMMALNSNMSIADIAGFLLYVTTFYEPVIQLSHVNESLQQALAAGDRYFEVLDSVPEIQDAPDAVSLPQVKGHIVYENVSFQYGEDVPVLRNINLEIQPGEMVALVGPTGVGKTTMANLIPIPPRGGC